MSITVISCNDYDWLIQVNANFASCQSDIDAIVAEINAARAGSANLAGKISSMDSDRSAIKSEISTARFGKSNLALKIADMDQKQADIKAVVDAGMFGGPPELYDALKAYAEGELCAYVGKIWMSLVGGNIGVAPNLDLNKWKQQTNCTPDLMSLLNAYVGKLQAGQINGVAGKMKTVEIGEIVIGSKFFSDTTCGSTATTFSTTSAFTNFGSGSSILPTLEAKLQGDSGNFYSVIRMISGSAFWVHPKHGDVRSDFTTGNTYTVQVSQESTDPADQQEGELDVVEYLLGSKYTNTDLWTTTIGFGLALPYWNNSNFPVTIVGTRVTGGAAGQNSLVLMTASSSGTYELDITNNLVDAVNVHTNGVDLTTIAGGARGTVSLDGSSANIYFYSVGMTEAVDITVHSVVHKVGNPYTVAELHGVEVDQYTNIAPDPTFTQDGSAGGWIVDGPISILNGVSTFNSAAFSNNVGTSVAGVEGKKYLTKTVVDEVTSGSLQVFTFANASDGTTDENLGQIITSSGTYYDVIETDVDSNLIGLWASVAGTTAKVSELSIFEIPDDMYGQLNTGYRGADGLWVNQLLGNLVSPSTGIRRLKLDKKAATPTGYYALNSTGSYVDISANCTFNSPGNYVDINISALWSPLGYTSEADMLANSAIRLEYKTRARVFRPAANPQRVKVLSDVYYANDHYGSFSNYLTGDLTGNVHTGTSAPLDFATKVSSYNLTTAGYLGQWGYPLRHGITALSSFSCKVGIKFIFGLFEKAGTYHVCVWFCELIWDAVAGNWGDDGIIWIVDNVLYKIDLNGHAVKCGCMSFDTGIPVGGA
ncbi:hypothetical protein [Maridesulfovibrio ferrireducens]|uniref:hypothetical protein n=1 Tax=Maridesulfovibrio ferrireducens TaxID=246191 RepID=UPI001A20E47D|nr:hypothetical protein [Maridesulfovibrio ferrireducens]MBI9110009.1 hypothetical protein [Maridesulfovibrio ferrireducens]